jgi:replicative DNA helicase
VDEAAPRGEERGGARTNWPVQTFSDILIVCPQGKGAGMTRMLSADRVEISSPGRRVLPHSLEAERSVVGGILLHPKAFSQVVEHVAAEEFYHPAHQAIFQAMVDLDNSSRPIDQVTVAEQMRASETFKALRAFNGESYFAELTSSVVTVENIGYHARMVRGKATVRKLIEAAQEVAAHGYGDYGDIDEFIDSAERSIFEIAQRSQRSSYERLGKILKAAIGAIEQRYERKQAITGVPSGFHALDAMTSGFQPGDLVIVAARPSMGKTSLVMNCVQNAAIDFGVPCLVFSLEMSKESLTERLICSESRIDSQRLRGGFLEQRDWINLTKGASRISEAPIWIDDSGAPTLLEIRAKCRRWRSDPAIFKSIEQHGMVVVDYLQLISGRAGGGKDQNREREISEISRGLKALAKELRVPVIALSQLNRGVESREKDKRPRLSDLRESGAIEQDADVIGFIYRDEVYNKETPDKGVAEVIIGKQRNGPVGSVRLRFLNEYTRFENE